MRWMLIGVTGVALFFLACSDSVQQYTTTSVVTIPIENIVFSSLNDSAFAEKENLNARCVLYDFYHARQNNLTWFKKDVLTPQGDSLLDILHRSHYFGLVPDDYHVDKIDTLRQRIMQDKNDLTSLTTLDILMTDAFMTLVSHIHYGRVDSDRKMWKGVKIDSTLLSAINRSINKNKLTDELKALEPQYFAYQLLKRDLKNKLDSIALDFTDSALTAKLINRVRDLCVNMEQWRWEEAHTGKPYIMVNIPSFHLDVIENDSVVFDTNVIVGTTNAQTPTFDASMVNMILYPYWNVPRDIATKELLPKIKKDSSYLYNSRYRVLDMSGNEVIPEFIDWKMYNVNNFPFMLQQSEGQHNALGIVKFNFINPYNIFLHDTNAKGLFDESKRTLSHGCIRVDRALELARLLVSRENRFCSVNDLQRFIKGGKQQQISLDPIDLRIRYFTCHPRKDGQIQFYEDVYGKNPGLIEAIYCRELISPYSFTLSKNPCPENLLSLN